MFEFLFKRKAKKISHVNPSLPDLKLALELTQVVLNANPARKPSVTDEVLDIYTKATAAIEKSTSDAPV